MQREVGQYEAALASAREAVTIHRTLAAAQPDTFLPSLANSLNNLSQRQSELGDREGALASAREAVGLRRRLADTRPNAFLHKLARSLTVFAMRLADLGRSKEALTPIQEAISELAKERSGLRRSERAVVRHRLLVRRERRFILS